MTGEGNGVSSTYVGRVRASVMNATYVTDDRGKVVAIKGLTATWLTNYSIELLEMDGEPSSGVTTRFYGSWAAAVELVTGYEFDKKEMDWWKALHPETRCESVPIEDWPTIESVLAS